MFSNLVPDFVWTAINLVILYFILKKILFKPLTEHMEKRSQSIENNINRAKNNKQEAKKLKLEYEKQLRDAHIEADKILDEARARARKEYDSIISDAKQEAKIRLYRARQEMEREREVMLKKVKNQITSLALAAASKVVEANMDNDKNREIISKFIDKEGVA